MAINQAIVTIDATHAGFVNENYVWYLEDQMQGAIPSWTQPYNKPVLTHHESKKDAIGHVIKAEYVPLPNTKDGEPKGMTRLTAVISDEDAIVKIRDQRYNTVSISADSNYAKCSICDHKIHEDGLCEHVRGKTYKDKKCFWYIGGLKYKEVSYVNTPADEYARTVLIEERQLEGGVMPTDDKNTTHPAVTVADSTQNPLVAPTATPTPQPDVEDEWKDYTEDDLALAYWLMTEVDNELAEDAKLSAEKRKSLSGSSFCGPNRSFPVNDCAHYTAALRLIGRYKGPGNKERIRGCIERKGKKLGCGGGTKDTIQNGELMQTLAEVILRDDVKQYLEAEIAKKVKDSESKLSALAALDEKVKTQTADLATKEKDMKTLQDTVGRLETDNTALKTELHKTLVDKVFDLRKNLKKKDVMSLKDEKESDAFKVELSKRSDESLKDAIKDLAKEETLTVPAPVTSSPDQIIDSKDITAQLDGVADPKKRAELVAKIIFAADKK